MASEMKPSSALKYVVLLVVLIIVVVAAAFVVVPSILQGAPSNGMKTTSSMHSTSSLSSSLPSSTSSNGSVNVVAAAATCTGSGNSEECRLTLTNSGTAGTTITGAGTLSYNEVMGMGSNVITTNTGCNALTGGLGPGQSEDVGCTFIVNRLVPSGTQVTGTVALGDGDSAAFSGTAS